MMRNKSVDMAKGIGMLWIIFSHTGYYFPFGRYFYYMYVPVFFVCSGYFFKLTDSTGKDLIKIFKRLFIPMIFCRLFYIAYYFYYRRSTFFTWETLRTVIRNNLYSRYSYYPFTYTGENIYFSDFGGGEWFLPALILSTLLYLFIRKFLDRKQDNYIKYCIIIVLILTVLSVALNRLPILLPWSLDTVPTCTIFMLFGDVLRRFSLLDKPLTLKKLPIFLILALILKLIADYNYDVNLSVRIYGIHGDISVMLYIINCFIACYLTLIACKWLESKEVFGVFSVIGHHTLFLYCTNGIFMEIIARVMYKTTAINYETGMFNLLKALAAICVGIFINYLIKSVRISVKNRNIT